MRCPARSPAAPARVAVTLAAVTLAACVEQEPPLTVSVQVEARAAARLTLPEGALAVDRALLLAGAVELVPCDEALAGRHPLRWLLGEARAHGQEGGGGLSMVVEPIDGLDPLAREIARIEVPPDLTLCGLRLGAGDDDGVALAGRVDGVERSWVGRFEGALRLPFPAVALDASRRTMTITLRFAVEDWVAGLPADDGARGRALAANAGATMSVEVR